MNFEEKCGGENSRVSFKGKLDEQNSGETIEEVGYRVGGSFEENMRVSKGGTSSGIEEEVGFRVGGRQGEGAGRFLLAAKTFQPGQPVLMETPLVQVQQGIFGWVDRTPIQYKIVFLKTGTFSLSGRISKDWSLRSVASCLYLQFVVYGGWQ